MSELILTEQEKADPNYLDWSDESIANGVRHVANLLVKMDNGKASMYAISSAHLLISMAEKTNSQTTTITMEGVTSSGLDNGDWVVTVERTRAPNQLDKEQA